MIRKKLMTVAMAAMFAASSLAMPVAAMAEETTETVEATDGQTVTHDGDVNVKNDKDAYYSDQRAGVEAGSKSTVTQNGDVTVKNGDGVSSEGGKVTVKGNVSAEGEEETPVSGIYATSSDDGEETNSDRTRGDVTVTGDVTAASEYSNGVNASDANVTVNGNVKATGDYATGVRAESDDYTEEIPNYDNSYARKENVTVNGNVTAEGTDARGIWAYNATGTEKDEGKASVTVNGNVSTSGEGSVTGIFAYQGGVVDVTGDISINTTETENSSFSSGVHASDNGSATVKGNVTATGSADHEEDRYIVGISLIGDSNVSVTGNVTSSDIGAAIGLTSERPSLVVDGTLKGENSALHIYKYSDEENSSGDLTYPQILVTTLATGENGDLISTDTEEDGKLSEETMNAIKAGIQYIIHADGFTTNGQTVTVNGQTYTVAKKGDTVTLTPSVPSGYKLTGLDFGSYQTSVKDNGDGTYQVVVREDGDLIFKANMEKIDAGTNTSNSSGKSSDKKTAKTSTTSNKGGSSTGSSTGSSSSGKTTSPKTGDNTNATVWVIVFAAALAGIGVSAHGARKNHR